MLKLIKELFSLLSREQKEKLITLQILVVLMAIAEVVGVASIGPFMAMIGDIELLAGKNYLATLYQASGLESPDDFIFFSGIAAFTVLSVSSIIASITVWRLSVFGAQIGTDIGDRLFNHYMHQPWLFHATNNSAKLTKQISIESARVTSEIVQPLLMMNSKIVMVVLMSAMLFVFNPLVAIVGLSVFVFAYVILYKLVRTRISQNGRSFTDANTERFKLMSAGFGGIKDILLLGRQGELVKSFNKYSNKISHSIGINLVYGQVPRYFMELIAFGSIIFLVLYLIQSHQSDLSKVLPVLAVYALAGFKLLPSVQQIYAMLARIKGGVSAFEAIKKDLNDSLPTVASVAIPNQNRLKIENVIKLHKINFTYPGKVKPAISQLSLEIPKNKVIGLVGSSGSGKSTTVDLILGLIQADSGTVEVDDITIDTSNLRAWQNSLGLVPQAIFLSDSSIMENVAFGLHKDLIDLKQLQKAISYAHLDEMISQLPDGVETQVGERGVQLSGGQKQRIGIARALYHDAEVLVLDEATSSLDGITEKLIMDAISEFSDKKTIIIIAHRLATVKKCDVIYFLDNGRVVDQGDYAELFANNPTFKKMTLSH